MFEQKMEEALNEQVNAELWSGYIYLSMSYDMENKGYEGITAWLTLQAKEEFKHATRIMKFIGERGGKVKLMPIDPVKQDWSAPLEAFEDAYSQEKAVTKKIDDLMSLAIELKDYATQNMLLWFVNEQVQEEVNTRTIVEKLKRIEGYPGGLYMLDKQLGKRKID